MKRARDIKEQLVEVCKRVEIDYEDPELSIFEDEYNTNIRKCITEGFFYNAARYTRDGIYRTLKNAHSVLIHPGSLMYKQNPDWIIYNELVLTTKEFMRNIVEIKPEWLFEIAPHYYKEKDIKPKEKKMPKNTGTSRSVI
jgi:pre-mRNA-splicing factor ATP-dependent RNA helicase DHX16